MNCTELRSRLQAYASGTLRTEEEAAFEAHLGSCEECAAEVTLAEARLAQAGALPKVVAPAQDLWPGIQERIERPRLAGRIALPKWALAAAAVLLIAASSAVTAVWLQPSSRSATQGSTRLVGLEAEYTVASDDLSAALAAARSRLAPETIAIIERNLASIDQALAESHRALALDPGNAALEQLVVAAWRHKVDLLRRATAIGSTS
jgi:predicted anti-sigma-YlaC factor YlaD